MKFAGLSQRSENKHRAIVIAVLLLPMMIFACCKTQYKRELIPIREANFRLENYLPLDSAKVEEAVAFVRAGGIRDEAGGMTSEIDVAPVREFLSLFREQADSIRTVKIFDRNSQLKRFINSQEYQRDIVNSCDSLGPEEGTRRAYLFHDYWYVFLIDSTTTADGTSILDAERRFSRLIVMKRMSAGGVK